MRIVNFMPAVGLVTVLHAVTLTGGRLGEEKEMEMGLAQVDEVEKIEKAAPADVRIAHSCYYTAGLKKLQPPSWSDYSSTAENARFKDSTFVHDDNVLFWSDMGEEIPDGLADQTIPVEWKRAYQTFHPLGRTLWGQRGISPGDIQQGSLGNCWFLAAASGLAATRPKLIQQVFINGGQNELNTQGLYFMNFWSLGVPSTVFVDDYLPLRRVEGTNGYQAFFARSPEDGSMWPLFLEKAFAKHHGNYLHIELGAPSMAVMALTGAPAQMHTHDEDNDMEQIWAKLEKHLKAGDIVNCASQPGSDTQQDDAGLPLGHAFTVLKVISMSNGDRLVKVRNPWGARKSAYFGPWGNDDTRWSAKNLKEAGFQNEQDLGIFHMQIEDYYKRMSRTEANINNQDMYYDYFMQLNDNSLPSGRRDVCGAKCTRHSLTVISRVEQKVHIAAHTWDPRDLPKKCMKEIRRQGELQNVIQVFPRAPIGFGDGPGMFDQPFKFKAGETMGVEVEFDFSDANKARDWSVVAWGEKGQVEVHHTSGLVTHSLPRAKEARQPVEKKGLPKYNYEPYQKWVRHKLDHSYNVYKDGTGRKWVGFMNKDAKDAFHWVFTTFTEDWNDIIADTSTFGDQTRDQYLDCQQDQVTKKTTCEITLEPGNFFAFVLEPGHRKGGLVHKSRRVQRNA